MVPSVLVVLETLPLTPNGKVDRRALGRIEISAKGTAGAGGEEGGEPRDILELQLARIWREVLGVPHIGIREDFFAIGGHSLLALSLMARVREQLGRDLPLAALFQAPTIESMAALLRQEKAPAVSCLVPIQPTGSHRPFFCVHPGGGDVLCYAPLARYLGPDRPFYGLQSRGLSGEAEPLRRIEDMAALYLEELRRVQPWGPYTLGGWSLGCIVAFEMAHQLREQGETVALLALLDGQAELGGEPEDDLTLLRDVVAYIENLWGRDLGLAPDELESLLPEDRLPRVMEKLREADFLPPGTGPEQLIRVLDVYRANTRAARAYVAKPWPERIVFFRTGEVTEEGPASNPRREPDLGWGRVTAGVDIHVVPGEHLTMVAEPYVQELARQLAHCLEEAEKEVEEALVVT
jgi:thioesterase domain-containing protein/aryl carrier-like protein